MNLVEDYLAHCGLPDAPAHVRNFRPSAAILLTPRFRHSRYVVTLLCDSAGRPQLVGKTARIPHDKGALGEEFAVLEAISARSGGGIAPAPLALAQHREHWMLIQTALPGRALGGRGRSAYPARVWGLVDGWLQRVGSATSSLAPAHWFDEAAADQTHALASFLPEPDRQRLLLTGQYARQLDGVQLPRPIEHGDLVPANVLLQRRHVAVVDWESGRIEGLPGVDAAVFLACLYFSRDRAETDEEKAASYRRHFLRADGGGRRQLIEHLAAQGVEVALVDQILLAAWARRGLAGSRARDGAGDVEGRPIADWSIALWLATLAHLADGAS